MALPSNRESNEITNTALDKRSPFSVHDFNKYENININENFDSDEEDPTSLTHRKYKEECSFSSKPFYNISCSSIKGNSAYGGVIKCVNNDTYILRAYWIGYHNLEPNKTVVGICKFCNSFYSSYIGRYVPLDLTNQCLTNRDNQLCSCCIGDKAPAVNSRNYTCIECNSKKMTIYFAANIICLFFLLAFIFIFNFFPASGALNPLIFFAQMITTTLRLDCMGTIPMTNVLGNTSKVDDILQHTSDFIYGIWNLDFTNPANSFCFAKSFETIHVLVINYFVAALPLIPVFVLALLARCLDKLQNRGGRTCKQIFGENCIYIFSCNCLRTFPWLQKMVRFQKWRSIKTLVASCLLLSYTKFAVTTIYLITPSYLYDVDGNKAGTVLYYQGNLKYFGPKHKKLGLLAIFFLVTFVIGFPLLLLLLRYNTGKTIPVRRIRGRRKMCDDMVKKPSLCSVVCKHFDDFLQTCLLKPFQRDLKWGKRNSRPCVGFKIWKLSFGIHDYRWYAGWYFILRFSLFAANLFSLKFSLQLIINQILCTFALIVSLVVQPYRRQIHNRLDAFIFILISLINSLIFSQYYLLNTEQALSKKIYIFQYFLVFIPLILTILYFLAKLISNYHHHQEESPLDEEVSAVVTPLPSNVSSTRSHHVFQNRQRFALSVNDAHDYQTFKTSKISSQTQSHHEQVSNRSYSKFENFKNRFLCSCYKEESQNEIQVEEVHHHRSTGTNADNVPLLKDGHNFDD